MNTNSVNKSPSPVSPEYVKSARPDIDGRSSVTMESAKFEFNGRSIRVATNEQNLASRNSAVVRAENKFSRAD